MALGKAAALAVFFMAAFRKFVSRKNKTYRTLSFKAGNHQVLPAACGALCCWAGRGRAEAGYVPERGPLALRQGSGPSRVLWLALDWEQP